MNIRKLRKFKRKIKKIVHFYSFFITVVQCRLAEAMGGPRCNGDSAIIKEQSFLSRLGISI